MTESVETVVTKKETKVRTSMTLAPELFTALKTKASELDQSVSALIEEAVRKFLQ